MGGRPVGCAHGGTPVGEQRRVVVAVVAGACSVAARPGVGRAMGAREVSAVHAGAPTTRHRRAATQVDVEARGQVPGVQHGSPRTMARPEPRREVDYSIKPRPTAWREECVRRLTCRALVGR
ncbi:hypothetical protein CZ771_03270 [Actinomycetales bacterium JB111]|nr:hypothetical protein CZ771_03270 [Actinomycetales bacterium JB111]